MLTSLTLSEFTNKIETRYEEYLASTNTYSFIAYIMQVTKVSKSKAIKLAIQAITCYKDKYINTSDNHRLVYPMTSEQVFTLNLTSSQLILAGEIHEARVLLSTVNDEELHRKFVQLIDLLTHTKTIRRLSTTQLNCLLTKLEIIVDILTNKSEL